MFRGKYINVNKLLLVGSRIMGFWSFIFLFIFLFIVNILELERKCDFGKIVECRDSLVVKI